MEANFFCALRRPPGNFMELCSFCLIDVMLTFVLHVSIIILLQVGWKARGVGYEV